MSLKRSLDTEEEETISIQDVIDQEKEEADIVSAVLGASDPIDCSYNKGYVYRQALYSCITCLNELKSTLTPEQIEEKTSFLHGICLACSYECHANHEVLELYTKRNFRCDCGNSKLPGANKCKLMASKESVNSLNKYNHNFDGQYCTCNRPYPETDTNKVEEADDEDDMIQCTICEDWYHQSHLKGGDNFPHENDYDEMICQGCMGDNKFLWNYQGYIASLKSSDSKETNDLSLNVEKLDDKVETECTNLETECFLKNFVLKNKDLDTELMDQACCFLHGWREGLCKCLDCLQIYKKNKIEFLLDLKDQIVFYETLGKSKQPTESDKDKEIDEQLSKMSRVSRVEFLHGVNDFKTELSDFLGNFAKKGEVVKSENINAFFEDLARKKRQKMEDSKSGNFY